MSTKVSLIDIMRAFYRWNPMDVKELFAEELNEELKAKDKRIVRLESDLNSLLKTENIVKDLYEKNEKIVLLENENQFIRNTNKSLHSEGMAIINDLNNRVQQLERQLSERSDELRLSETQNQELVKSIESIADLVKQNSDLHKKSALDCTLTAGAPALAQLGATSDQSATAAANASTLNDQFYVITGINASADGLTVRQKINKLLESNRQYARRLFEALVQTIMSLRDENSKLKQKIKEKNVFIHQMQTNNKNENNLNAIQTNSSSNDLDSNQSKTNNEENSFEKFLRFIERINANNT